ncbi:MAG: SOS response-associated peptidase [Rhodospirillaceae bacterium]|nr:SOS response-associated peptidase [Rhodospirillaceae bacterium]MDE0000533.1 SOS response-associated peptidase [Rhodospirillaceae bacterium]
MCGRYNIATDTQALMDAFGVIDAETSVDLANRYNIGPSEPPPIGESIRERRVTRVPTIRLNGHRRVMRSAIWPLIPVWSRGIVPRYATANARSETVARLPAYRHAWASDRRCLVPASSFVEWQAVAGSRRKQPWLVYLADRRPMAFAGLWEYSHTDDGERVESCTIVTAPANALMAEIHNTRKRMPVVLEGRFEQDTWLAGTKEKALAVAAPLADGLLDAHPISTRINNPNARGRELLDPVSIA